jgi:hypothetical protein
LQEIGTELLKTGITGFCEGVISSCGWRPGDSLLIDGLRHIETVDPIRRLVSPTAFKIMLLTVSEATRYDRLKHRGEGQHEAIRLIETHSSEQQIDSVLAAAADLIINTDRPVSIIVAELVAWIATQGIDVK